jgi:hypothetical protein
MANAFDDMPDFAAVSVAGATPAVVQNVWNEICRQFWVWYQGHKNDSIHAKLIILPISVKVSKLRKVFVALFGPEQG